MIYSILYIFTVEVVLKLTCAEESEYPDINDLFPAFTEPDPSEDLPPDTYRNISVDVEKIDMKKFNDDMVREMLQKIRNKGEKYTNESRRFGIPFFYNYPVYNEGTVYYYRAMSIATSQLGADMILQMIYMAKSQMTAIESNTYFDTSNTAYRAGFLGFKMKKYFRKLTKIYTYMRKYAYVFPEMKGHIILHHRAVKVHVDFLYYSWVLTTLDGKYKDRLGSRYKAKLASSEVATGGVSVEVPSWISGLGGGGMFGAHG